MMHRIIFVLFLCISVGECSSTDTENILSHIYLHSTTHRHDHEMNDIRDSIANINNALCMLLGDNAPNIPCTCPKPPPEPEPVCGIIEKSENINPNYNPWPVIVMVIIAVIIGWFDSKRKRR
jgi:hypothetical protein